MPARSAVKLLVVGGGGREHAIVDKLRRDVPEAEVLAAPGNPGIAATARTVPVGASDLEALAELAAAEAVDLTVVGPEAPLAAGIADLFEERRLPLFGPSRAAARLESSKAFAKRVMAEVGVPTAAFRTFTDPREAREHVSGRPLPMVVKASGLAAGKGAFVCRTREEALRAVRETMEERRFGEAGEEVVVEDFLEGEELSAFFLADGERAVPLLPSRDYKRAGEGDHGPNTGGMGAYAPAGRPGRAADAAERARLLEEVRERIARPVLEAMAERGTPYRGFLYAGLMLTAEGPMVVEFNCRLGDPEAQVVLPLTRSSLVEPMRAVARGEPLTGWSAEPAAGAALVTVLASGGYPGSYEKGKPIRIPPALEDEDRRIYHAGTARRGGELVTAGGRVLGVTGLGEDLPTAARRSRAGAEGVEFEGKRWRRDIGFHDLEEPASGGPGSPDAADGPASSRASAAPGASQGE